MSWDVKAHPWIAGGLRIDRSTLVEVEQDVLRGYAADEEACGYLQGPADDAALCDSAKAMPNLAAKLNAIDPERYFRSPRTFFAFNEKRFQNAVDSGTRDGRPIKILYHSHLDVGAYLSPTDRAVMSMGTPPAAEGEAMQLGAGPAWPLAFLVTSVTAEGIADHKLYIWNGDDFAESSFEVVGAENG